MVVGILCTCSSQDITDVTSNLGQLWSSWCQACGSNESSEGGILPPNCTSIFQPMDSGIIAMLKKNYMYKLLQRMFEIFDEGGVKVNMIQGTMGLSVSDVIGILFEVWNDIKPQQAMHCWRKSTLVDHNQSTAADEAGTVATSESTVATSERNDSEIIVADMVEFVKTHDCKPLSENDFDHTV